MTWQFFSVLPVWVVSVGAAVIIAATSAPGQQVTFFIQLAIQRKEGFVVRAMASIGGSVVVLGIASAVFALAG